MDTFDLEEEKRKESSSRRLRLTFVFISTLAVLSFGVYAFFYGLGAPKNFLYGTVTAALKTFHEVFGSGGGGKLVAEIDLNGGQEQFAGALPVPGTPASAAIYADGEISAAAGEGRESNSAEPSTKIISENVSAAAAGTAAVSSSKVAKNNSGVAERLCSFTAPGEPTHELIFSEIAWMGSVPQGGETAAQAANDEWLELKNISRDDIDLAGWQILDDSGKFKIVFAGGEKLSAGGFYLLERSDDDSVPGVKANKIYSGALSNSGMNLRFFGADCGLIDAVDASSGWPAGDNATKATMERNANDFGWHTSASPGGTPKVENSLPVAVAATQAAVSSSTATASTSSVTASSSIVSSSITSSGLYYNVGVSLQGGSGTIISTPAGIFCGIDCSESYKEGTQIVLTATPDTGSEFIGWSGPCSGSGVCIFTVENTTAVVAVFKSLAAPVSSSDENQGGQTSSSTAPAPASVNHLVISNVQIAGASAANDFIKIYNPTGVVVDISNWKLRKKTKLATDYTSIRVFPSGSTILSLGYFTWANSANGFSVAIGADASSSEELTASSSIALFDASLNLIDAVAWGSGHADPYVEGAPYPDSPSANQILSRKFVDGVVQDTDNNSQDFFIQ